MVSEIEVVVLEENGSVLLIIYTPFYFEESVMNAHLYNPITYYGDSCHT